ncbi:MAG: hypothetical protein A4E64_02501 [Syntrophorhabdus sp. PtaU1.Bin058]|nr:MAG: hypothetical protein A4E64_02501 [Syntrophorhabdus sp. PtaU1.Bin058]
MAESMEQRAESKKAEGERVRRAEDKKKKNRPYRSYRTYWTYNNFISEFLSA